MPQVTVYVREDDLAKWKALEKKSEWLSARLNYVPPKTIWDDGEPAQALQPILNKVGRANKVIRPVGPSKTLGPDLLNIPGVQRASELETKVKLCKVHGIPLDSRGRCMQKSCKYA